MDTRLSEQCRVCVILIFMSLFCSGCGANVRLHVGPTIDDKGHFGANAGIAVTVPAFMDDRKREKALIVMPAPFAGTVIGSSNIIGEQGSLPFYGYNIEVSYLDREFMSDGNPIAYRVGLVYNFIPEYPAFSDYKMPAVTGAHDNARMGAGLRAAFLPGWRSDLHSFHIGPEILVQGFWPYRSKDAEPVGLFSLPFVFEWVMSCNNKLGGICK